jgi:plasmid replication initiation protein
LLEVKNEEFAFQICGNKGKAKVKVEEAPFVLKEQHVKKPKEKRIEKVEESSNPLEYYKIANALLPLPKDSSSLCDDNEKSNNDAFLDDTSKSRERGVTSNFGLPISGYGKNLPSRLEIF